MLSKPKLAAILVGSLAILCLLYAGYHFLRQERFLYLARRHLREDHKEQASFYAKLTLQAAPRSSRAMELLAQASSGSDLRQALYWRGKLAEKHPDSPRHQLDFARALLEARNLDSAEKIMAMAESLPQADHLRLGELQAALALARKKPEEAETIYRMLLSRHSSNHRLQYSLANILLASRDSHKREEGRALLETLWKGSELRMETARSLLALAIVENKTDKAQPWIAFLQGPEGTIPDLCLAGEALMVSGQGLSSGWLSNLTKRCRHAEDAYAALKWFRKNARQETALRWFDALPLSLRESPLVLMGRAEVLGDLKQWDEIIHLLNKEKWGRLDPFRHAFLRQSHLPYDPNRQSTVNQIYWKHMIDSLADAPQDFYRLSFLIRHWGWPEHEQENLLAEFMSKLQPAKEKLLPLIREATYRKDTLALFYFGRKALEIDPESLVARNNVANYGLLLQKDLDDSLQLADKLFQEHPENAAVRVTEAFALYRRQRFPEALALMAALPKETLSRPGTALYYSLLLRSNGREKEALTYAEIARKSLNLLPEEEKLLKDTEPLSPSNSTL